MPLSIAAMAPTAGPAGAGVGGALHHTTFQQGRLGRAGRVAGTACSLHLRQRPSAPLAPRPQAPLLRRQRRPAAVGVQAMVNVDFSPSVLLGVGLIGAGTSLWQLRKVKPEISKDYDVVISCVSLLVGGILIFQGWRLDPLLLFGQLMTTGAAVSFAIEALRLRSERYEGEEKAQLRSVIDRSRPPGGDRGAALQLPPPEEESFPLQQQQQWSAYDNYDASSSQQQQQWDDGYAQSSGGYLEHESSQYPSDSAAVQYDSAYASNSQQEFSAAGPSSGGRGGIAGGQPVVEADYAVPPSEYVFPVPDPAERSGRAGWQQGGQQQAWPGGRRGRQADSEDWD